jgi:predicted membrane channel-forming protein YqfA (hemolysin III family)
VGERLMLRFYAVLWWVSLYFGITLWSTNSTAACLAFLECALAIVGLIFYIIGAKENSSG